MGHLARACGALMAWLRACGPELGDVFDAGEVCKLPPPVAREALRRWLTRHAGADVDVMAAAVERLTRMAGDFATPPRQHFPGRLLVRRRGSKIFVDGSNV